MRTKTLAVCFLATAALAGCSHPGEKPVDYHSLISTTQRTQFSEVYKQAQMRCNESQTGAERMTNPWCSAIHKADICSDSIMQNGIATAAGLARVEKDPTVACPPK